MAKILIVDDSAYLRLMIRKVLTKAGHEIIGEASNGEEAVSLYKNLQPDIVTMDVVMPKQNGLQALKEIMDLSGGKARVIIVTALGHEPLVNRALKMGARNFVVKPFKPEQLIRAVDSVL